MYGSIHNQAGKKTVLSAFCAKQNSSAPQRPAPAHFNNRGASHRFNSFLRVGQMRQVRLKDHVALLFKAYLMARCMYHFALFNDLWHRKYAQYNFEE